MTREEFRDYVDLLRSQDEISYDVYSGLIDRIDTLEQDSCTGAITISRQEVLGIVDSYSQSKSNIEDVTQDIISDIMALQPVNPQQICGDAISRQWLMECVNEGWVKFDTEQDKNIFIHLVRDIAPPVTPQGSTDKSNLEKICEELKAENNDLRDQLAMRDRFQKQKPCEDAINRVDALMCLTGEIKETDTIETIIARFVRRIRKLPPVNPQKCEVGNPCLYCRHEFESQEGEENGHMTIDEFAELFTESEVKTNK